MVDNGIILKHSLDGINKSFNDFLLGLYIIHSAPANKGLNAKPRDYLHY